MVMRNEASTQTHIHCCNFKNWHDWM